MLGCYNWHIAVDMLLIQNHLETLSANSKQQDACFISIILQVYHLVFTEAIICLSTKLSKYQCLIKTKCDLSDSKNRDGCKECQQIL